MSVTDNNYFTKHKKFRIDSKKLAITFTVFAFIVTVIIFWWLKLTGITVTGEALCGASEHTHTSDCYETRLICDYEQISTVTSEEEFSDTEKNSTAEETTAYSEESTFLTHIHTDECYTKTLICTEAEHSHSAECFPDNTADIETVSDWLKTLENVELTNNIPENLIAVALSQLGYEESNNNFQYDENGNRNGYTRYGEWYGSPYGKWNTMFLSFCLHFSNINNSEDLKSAGAEAMRLSWKNRKAYVPSGDYTANRGDVAFFDNDLDGTADTVGIILSVSENSLVIISGDSNNKVEKSYIEISGNIIGYGLTSEFSFAEDTEYENELNEESQELQPMLFMLSNDASSEAQALIFEEDDHPEDVEIDGNIAYSSNLEYFLCNVQFQTQNGEILDNNSTVYIGETYVIALEFSEINYGEQWLQFKHHDEHTDIDPGNEHHYYLHYQIPSYLHCEAFTEWHSITAKTENGTIEDVGKYFVNENGYLLVQFYEVEEGICFGTIYSNVDFTINFNAQVGEMEGDDNDVIDFGNSVDVQFNVNGGAAMTTSKTHGQYDGETHTVEYTLRVEAVHGVVHNLVVDDQIYDSHRVLRDTIVVTDLDGNILDPQPTVSDSLDIYATGGVSLSGFPSFAAGKGYLITYKSKIDDALMSNDSVGLWNGLYSTGAGTDGSFIDSWTDDWGEFELEKIAKGGKQKVLQDANGNYINVIEWEVAIRKNNSDLEGTVIIDTLGEGLSYYTGQDILIRHYDEYGNSLADMYLRWDNVTINGNSMSFPLPEGYQFEIIYYSTYEQLNEDELKHYTNSVSAEINGIYETTGGTADVVGFVPRVNKTSSGDDGEYAYFTIEADVPSVIKNWGNFYLTDMAAFWGYNNDAGYLYVENIPEDMVITAVTESGNTVTFTPYVAGGPIENTYILVAPAEEKYHHSFNIFFNTSTPEKESSKWMLNENSVLTISYKLPFDAKTGTEWEGEFTGNKTVGDVLFEEKSLANESFLNYTDVIQSEAVTTYKYSPKITKNSVMYEDGTIDYTVIFYNSLPGTYGNSAYLNYNTVSSYFTDTFDNRLEYVDGSLTLTCYDPWRDFLWLNKYSYKGSIEGNSINLHLNNFTYDETNPEAAVYGWSGLTHLSNAENYYKWMSGGGRYVFTYTLKVKDEYLYSPDTSKLTLSNTAEVIWDTDKTSGPVTETKEFKTGNLDKSVVQKDNELEFFIHINRNALDILPGADTLTIEDIMTTNISIYWNTIKLYYEDSDGSWIDFDSDNSQYTYTVTYDQPLNKLTFTVPDSLHIRADYTTLITENSLVSVGNSVEIIGKAQVSDIIDAVFKVDEHSGDASASMNEITLLKQDGATNSRLSGVTFHLYGLVGNTSAVLPEGAAQTIVTDNNKTLKYIGSYTTGEDGTVLIRNQYLTVGGPYALVEDKAPEGYNPLTKPEYFYFYDTDPDGIYQTVTTIIAIENYTYTFVLPETGGTGTLPLTIIGSVLMTAPILYSIIRRKRERRLTRSPDT